MKSNTLLILTVLFFLVFCSCSKNAAEGKGGVKGEAGKIKTATIDGIPHVYNPGKPLKGELTLELEQLLEIDSLKIDRAQPPSFSEFNRSGDRIYLFDMPQFKIFIFDDKGKPLDMFPIKGQGPGEIERVTQNILVPRNNDLWVSSDSKVMRYNRDGKFLDEIKFQKQYREVSIIDENCFIGQYFVLNQKETDEMKKRKLFCAMFDRDEKVLVNYLEGEGLGGLPVIGRGPGGQLVKVVFVMPSIVPDIVYGLDQAGRLIYLCKNMDYVVFLKNLKGEMLRVIHREHQNKLLGKEDRKEVVDLQLFGQPPEFKNMLAENLPAHFCAILGLNPLPRGYLAVYLTAGPQKYDIDIFDPDGRYIYRLKFPAGIESPPLRFYPGGIIGIVQTIEDRDIYREYRVKNLTEIFGNTTG